jgi:hypothetical protein
VKILIIECGRDLDLEKCPLGIASKRQAYESRCQSAIRPMSHMNGSTWPLNTHAPLQML